MANSNAASKLFVCSTPQNSDLTQIQFETLVWVEVKGVGNIGEMGINTNMLVYDTWSDAVTQKAKGMTDAGSPEVECARLSSDPGQLIMIAAGAVGNANNFAFKMVRSDSQGSGSPSVFYNRGLVSGPRRPNGRNEDFDIIVFTLGLQQAEVIVNAGAAGNLPSNTVAPAISGTLTVGQTASLSNGTWTGGGLSFQYQWYANSQAIVGATANTLLLTSAELNKRLSAVVLAQNINGSGLGFASVTAPVA